MDAKASKELVEENKILEKYLKVTKALINSKEFEKFNLLKQDNLKVQLEAMTVYYNTLQVRLKEVK